MEKLRIVTLGTYDADMMYRNVKTTPKRTVSIYEIELPTEDGGISHIDGNDYPIRHDFLTVTKPGNTRNTTLPFKCYYLHIDAEGEAARLMDSVPVVFKVSDAAYYRKLFMDIIIASSSNKEYSDMLVKSRLFELLYLIARDGRAAENNGDCNKNTCNPLIVKALKYMDEMYCDKNTLRDISGYVNLSPIYFHKLFKTAVGETPYQYLLKKKIKKALRMLMISDKSLTDIAFECGFSSQSYFNYVFKRECGRSPGEYRREMYRNYEKNK